MSWNTFGRIFRVTTFGESHGSAIGCVVDGCPAGIELSEADVRPYLEKRRPGRSRFTSSRDEPDEVKILSGVYRGRTLGTPISMVIENRDARAKDYDGIADKFRPNHADYVYHMKYGRHDRRGSGRASGRETATRVAAAAVARKVLPAGVNIRAGLVGLGRFRVEEGAYDWDETERNELFCPDAKAVDRWREYLDDLRKRGTSCGALVEAVVEGVPVGWGAPVYAKLEADLAGAMLGINAAKAFELGDGLALACAEGHEVADEMYMDRSASDEKSGGAEAAGKSLNPARTAFRSNRSGGIIAGISTGQPIRIRVAFKPTASIRRELRTVDVEGNDATVSTLGRHDPCVGIRAVPVVEAMAAITLADHYLLARAGRAAD